MKISFIQVKKFLQNSKVSTHYVVLGWPFLCCHLAATKWLRTLLVWARLNFSHTSKEIPSKVQGIYVVHGWPILCCHLAATEWLHILLVWARFRNFSGCAEENIWNRWLWNLRSSCHKHICTWCLNRACR